MKTLDRYHGNLVTEPGKLPQRPHFVVLGDPPSSRQIPTTAYYAFTDRHAWEAMIRELLLKAAEVGIHALQRAGPTFHHDRHPSTPLRMTERSHSVTNTRNNADALALQRAAQVINLRWPNDLHTHDNQLDIEASTAFVNGGFALALGVLARAIDPAVKPTDAWLIDVQALDVRTRLQALRHVICSEVGDDQLAAWEYQANEVQEKPLVPPVIDDSLVNFGALVESDNSYCARIEDAVADDDDTLIALQNAEGTDLDNLGESYGVTRLRGLALAVEEPSLVTCSWLVRFEVNGRWVADQFDLDDERALDMLAHDLGWANIGTELGAKVLAAPPRKLIRQLQGASDDELAELDAQAMATQRVYDLSERREAARDIVELLSSDELSAHRLRRASSELDGLHLPTVVKLIERVRAIVGLPPIDPEADNDVHDEPEREILPNECARCGKPVAPGYMHDLCDDMQGRDD